MLEFGPLCLKEAQVFQVVAQFFFPRFALFSGPVVCVVSGQGFCFTNLKRCVVAFCYKMDYSIGSGLCCFFGRWYTALGKSFGWFCTLVLNLAMMRESFSMNPIKLG